MTRPDDAHLEAEQRVYTTVERLGKQRQQLLDDAAAVLEEMLREVRRARSEAVPLNLTTVARLGNVSRQTLYDGLTDPDE